MLAVYVIGALAAAAGFYACRKMLLAQLRAESPEIHSLLESTLSGESIWDAFGPPGLSDNFLKNHLNRFGVHLDETSRVWLYAKLMRVCMAAFYLMCIVPFLSFIFAPIRT